MFSLCSGQVKFHFNKYHCKHAGFLYSPAFFHISLLTWYNMPESIQAAIKKIPYTGQLINNRNLFGSSWKSKSNMLGGLVSGESHLCGS